MQMSSNKELRSLTLGSAHEKLTFQRSSLFERNLLERKTGEKFLCYYVNDISVYKILQRCILFGIQIHRQIHCNESSVNYNIHFRPYEKHLREMQLYRSSNLRPSNSGAALLSRRV